MDAVSSLVNITVEISFTGSGNKPMIATIVAVDEIGALAESNGKKVFIPWNSVQTVYLS